MRFFYIIPLVFALSGCGVLPPASDIAIGGTVGYALYGDEIEAVPEEEWKEKLQDPKTYRDSVPPQAKQGARRIADNIRDNVRHNSRKFKEWWFYDPEKEKAGIHEQAVPSSYCYSVLQDVVCYPGPMPGWEHRLVGHQGGGITVVETKTEPLPKLETGKRITPDDRLKAAAPVFGEIPEEIKKERSEGTAISGSAQEILPDPLISPQL